MLKTTSVVDSLCPKADLLPIPNVSPHSTQELSLSLYELPLISVKVILLSSVQLFGVMLIKESLPNPSLTVPGVCLYVGSIVFPGVVTEILQLVQVLVVLASWPSFAQVGAR